MKPASQNGFTLIEMAIVLMIVGLLLGGLLVPLSAQMDQRNISDTQKAMSEIKEALIGYAMANGRLPCPAVPTTPTGQTASGVSAGTCSATQQQRLSHFNRCAAVGYAGGERNRCMGRTATPTA